MMTTTANPQRFSAAALARPSTDAGFDRGTVIVNDAAIGLPEVGRCHGAGHRVIVAGDDSVQMSLAEIVLPGADRVWANLRRSSELCRLRAQLGRAGGCAGLVLVARDGSRAQGLTLMQVMLALLPLVAGASGRVLLVVPQGAGLAAVTDFVCRIGPTLQARGVSVDLRAGPDQAGAGSR